MAAAPVRAQLPQLGDTGDMGTSAERKLGERIARELYRDPDYIDDPILVEYVQRLWQPLLDAARGRGELTAELDERFAWQVLLGKDRSVNAFALPGGWLGLHSGLIAVTTTRDELASVLAHELSHVTQRHISRMVTQQNQQAPWMVAAMILGAMAASKNPQMGGAIVAGSQGLGAQQALNFSRDMEREADRIGFGVMTAAGFEPQGFVSMFEKLQQAARLNDSGAYPYLRTHPMTTERAADMQARQQLAARAPVQPTLEHAMVAARARVISNAGVDALRGMVAEAESAGLASQPRPRQAGALYAGALSAARLRDAATTRQLLSRLDTAAAGDAEGQRLARLLAAEIAQAQQDWPRVLQLVDPASDRRPEVLLATQAWTHTGRSRDAAQRLQTWVAAQPRDAAAWQLLAAAYGEQGQALRGVRAEAEARVAQLDYRAAMDRFRAAQDMARKATDRSDYIEASIIDTRARQVESLLREQSLER
ncbi:M48 family metalloprotease [Ramlibacter sp. USB13]|uniref:M48 family metalloprotease n=1 Tax=Ramlibacter cellulosilyticus TaxID=2764187 RepID=A0A923SEC7_9BURK|nr:M48 family metalloprotease [Ramlibacter cellulosilyticus]MBC5782802.1 M48 family metalloprotease [Ramlibacter cellulosilyticus]